MRVLGVPIGQSVRDYLDFVAEQPSSGVALTAHGELPTG